ncbi:MAG: SapC family protein, partial [Desulfobia sp.]
TDKGNDYTVCLDTDAPHFSEEQGDPLYTANGEPAEVLERARDFLQRYQQEMLETEKVGTLLQDHGVLVEKQFTVGKGEKKSTIKGFRTVDMGKVAELDDKTLADWVRRGIFGFIYAHLHSLDNIKALAAKQDIGGEKN